MVCCHKSVSQLQYPGLLGGSQADRHAWLQMCYLTSWLGNPSSDKQFCSVPCLFLLDVENSLCPLQSFDHRELHASFIIHCTCTSIGSSLSRPGLSHKYGHANWAWQSPVTINIASQVACQEVRVAHCMKAFMLLYRTQMIWITCCLRA